MLQCWPMMRPRLTAADAASRDRSLVMMREGIQLKRVIARGLVAPGIELREGQPLGQRLNHFGRIERAVGRKRDPRDFLLPRCQANAPWRRGGHDRS